MKSIYFLSLLSVLFSCAKEEPYIIPETQIKESYIPEISEFVTGSRADCDCPATSWTLPDTYLYYVQYRFTEGFSIDNKYYYTVERKIIEQYDTPSSSNSENDFYTASNWTETNYYYRYDWQFKKAYLFQDDVNNIPLEVFDFNLKIGDQFNLTSHLDSADIIVEVDTVYNISYGELSLPIVGATSLYNSTHQSFSVFTPNVFAFEKGYLHEDLLNSLNLPECILNTPWYISSYYNTEGPGSIHHGFIFSH